MAKFTFAARYEWDGSVTVYADDLDSAEALAAEKAREVFGEQVEEGLPDASEFEIF